VLANGVDTIASFTPASGSSGSSGIGTTNVVSLPNYIPNPAGGDFLCQYLPAFVAASQNTTVYVANYGVENAPSVCNPNGTPPNPTSTDSIAVVSTSTNALTNLVYLPAGSHPVAMAQVPTPGGNKLYVANQGTNTISSFNTVDMTTNPVTGFTGVSPAWLVARGDGQQLYVLSQGDGQLWTFNTANDTVTGSVSVGAGANYVLYDPNLNRLYVTNPNNSSVYVFSVAGNLPSLLSACGIPALGSGISTCLPAAYSSTNYPSCVNNPCPMSVTALPDGTRWYVASYQLSGSGCLDPAFTTPASLTSAPVCFVSASVTVVDALTNTIKSTISAFPSTVPSVPEVANCLPANAQGVYSPGLVQVANPPSGPVYRFATRFRVAAAAAADSSRVYVSVCDAGSVAIVNTTDSNTNNPGFKGTVNTNGTAVTWVSGNQFGNLVADDTIVINGVTYTITGAVTPTALTITASAGAQSDVSYSAVLPADTLVLDLPTPFGTGTTSNAAPQQNPIFLLPGR
jgi:DNA-binding beta-propeller fold protein YncE